MRTDKFHGRYECKGRLCDAPGCEGAGEFRAPGLRRPSFDGPGEWRWFCLDHVREFNSGFDFFEGMSADEILAAQSPVAGWARETRAFRPDAGATGMPRWADFDDPLDAIGARAADLKRRAEARHADARRSDGARNGAGHRRFTPHEREALSVMGLSPDADRAGLRARYSQLVRKYHPDRNGGDRSHEAKLQRVVEAYQLLRRAGGM